MQIIELPLNQIKPYAKNPRSNGEAVKFVKKSIKAFGFKVPIVIDSDGEIVAGHTRYEAAKSLNLESVPCIVADDLNDEQIKAFRLADNKVSEKALWDFDLLDEEISKIVNFDMADFGFQFIDSDSEPTQKKNERLRTDEAYKLHRVDLKRTEGQWQIPVLKPERYTPKTIIPFNYALSAKDTNAGVHFYIDDYQFERIWAQPDKYIKLLQKFDCVFTPDFSLYLDMPQAMQIWNIYRSRLIGQMMQDTRIIVIPTVSWAQEESFAFCFDGLPKHSTISISTIGVQKDKVALAIWKAGVDKLIQHKKPACIIVYGEPIEYDYGKIKAVYFSNNNTQRMRDVV